MIGIQPCSVEGTFRVIAHGIEPKTPISIFIEVNFKDEHNCKCGLCGLCYLEEQLLLNDLSLPYEYDYK